MKGDIFLLKLFSIALIFAIAVPSFGYAETALVQLSVDKYHYNPNGTMTIYGAVYNESGAKPSTDVTLSFSGGSTNDTYTVTSDSSGYFTKEINVSDNGQFFMNASYGGSSSSNINFDVSNVGGVAGGIGNNYYEINLAKEWNGSTDWNTAPIYNGTFSAGSTPFNVLVNNESDNNGAYICSEIFVDDDANLNSTASDTGIPLAKYLSEGSKFTMNGTTYVAEYIDPKCTKVILVEYTSSTFGGGETKTLAISPVDANDSALNISDLGGNVTYEIYKENGTKMENVTTDQMNWTFDVPSDTGQYYIYADGYLVDSFEVKKFDMVAKMLDSSSNEITSGIAAGQSLNLTISLLNSTTGATISTGTVIAKTNVTTYTLQYDSSKGYYTAAVTAPSSGSAIYYISATVGASTQTTFLTADVRAFKINTMAFAAQKGEGEGVSPNSNAMIIVSAYNISSGESLNLSTSTNNCNITKVALQGLYNKKQENKVSGYSNKNLTAMLAEVDAPEFVKEEMTRRFGGSACVINFTTPNAEGAYSTEVNVTIGSASEISYSSINVQQLFVSAHPMSMFDAYQWYVTPGSRVYLGIDAFDGATGTKIDAANITSASLIEVMAGGNTVTDYMVNETFETVTIDNSQYAALSFIVNDSTMGDHMVKFKIKANVTRNGAVTTAEAEGRGWFMEKKYHVFAMPMSLGGQWYFGSSDTVQFQVNVYDESSFASFGTVKNLNDTTSTSTSLDNMAVTVEEVREAFTWKMVSVNATSTTTDTSGRATLNVTPASGSWNTGSYEAKIKLTSSDGTVTDYGHAWFEVKNFMFYAWTQNWQVASGQAVPISAQVSSANWTPVNGATVRLTKILYRGGQDKGGWMDAEVSFNASAPNISAQTDGGGMASIIIPANTISQSGQYEAILTATVDGANQTSRAWFQSKSYVIVARDYSKQNMWNPTYSPNSNMTLNVTAGTSYDWSNWMSPLNGSHNLSNAWVDTIEKQGIMGPFMKKGDSGSQNIVQSSSCSANNCQLRINLSTLDVGSYVMKVVANDTNGAQETEWYSFTVRTFDITTPELKRVRVSTAIKYNNKSSIITDNNWKSCSDSQLTKPTNATDCKAISSYKFFDSTDPSNIEYRVLIDLGNNKIFLDPNTTRQYNFNESLYADIPNYTVGDKFNISGVWFQVTSVGTTVRLESNNSVNYDGYTGSGSGTSGANGKPDYDVSSAGCQGAQCLLKTTDSTGNYYLKHEQGNCWECFADDEWLGIDLNGNAPNYWDSYYLAVQEYETGGIKSIYADNDSDLRIGSHIYPGAEPANFTANGTPIYYVGASFSQGTSAGQTWIEATFTSNKTGWNGMSIGTFKPGTNVSIPVLVADADGNRLAGATINISEASLLDQGPPTTVSLSESGIATTDANGIAVVVLNTSWFMNPFSGGSAGTWAIKIKVNKTGSGTATSTGMPWEWPKIEIRNFQLRVEPGLFGTISGLKKLNTSLGTLSAYNMYDASMGRILRMDKQDACGTNVTGTWDWEYGMLYINKTANASKIIVDTNRNCNLIEETVNYSIGDTIPIYDTNRNFTQYVKVQGIKSAGSNIVHLSPGENTTALGVYYRLNNISGPSANITTRVIEWNWENTRTYQNNDYIDMGAKVGVNDTSINITWEDFDMVELTNPWNLSLGGDWKVAKIANITNTTYSLLIYDNASIRNGENYAGLMGGGGFGPVGERTFADQGLLINSTGDIVRSVLFGQNILEISKTLFGGKIWENKMYLTNLANIPYPLPWTCDGTEEFWAGNFTEGDVQVDLNSQGGMGGPEGQQGDGPNASQSYNTMLYDNNCDGISSVSGGMYDDDLDMLQSNICSQGPGGCTALDLYGINSSTPLELGGVLQDGGGMPRSFDERFFQIGQENWPMQFVSYNLSNPDNGTITTQTRKEVFSTNDTVAYMIKAVNLDGTGVNGNATVTRVMDMSQFTPVATPPDVGQIVNGVGVLRLANFTNQHTSGGFIINIAVCDTSAVCESIERPVFIGSMNMMKCTGECPDGGEAGPGGP